MAIIQYSALVNRIKGRVSHSVISNWKGRGVLKRHNGSPRQAHNYKQQEIRGLLSDLSGEYFDLSFEEKAMWNSYAVQISPPITALNAYVKHNQIIQKYFPGTDRLIYPPTSPETPIAIGSSYATSHPAAEFCVFWAKPTVATLTIVVDFSVQVGRRNEANPSWTFGASCAADENYCLVQTQMPPGYTVFWRARTVDIEGKVSPWSSTHSFVTLGV